MPEIDTSQNLNRNRKSGCCNWCRLFPSYSTDDQTEQIINTNKEAYSHFKDDLPQPLDPGTLIKVTGTILPECSRFAINLCCGKEDYNDIALHLNPRISQRYVVRNSRIKDRWGVEEVTTLTKFELYRNQQFQIDILITETQYLININGIEGLIDLIGVEFEKTSTYPTLHKPIDAVEEISENLETISTDQNLTLPLTLSLKDGFQQGWQLEIQGRVKILPINFTINLQDGHQVWPYTNKYLHLNPRFGYANTRHVFVRNAWLDGGWGPEERVECFLFTPGKSFSLAIRKCDSHFSVFVDSQLSGEFKFRGDVDKINTVYIQGDVIIKSVGMRYKVSDKYFHQSKQSIASNQSE